MDNRKLKDLISVGPATLEDFKLIGIESVEQLIDSRPEFLYEELCIKSGVEHDICCLDVFKAAVAQARDPNLPKEKCNWWYWSKIRKGPSK